jgi:hypothetical protein
MALPRPTAALPRKRRRGRAQALLPPLLAGEGRGGGFLSVRRGHNVNPPSMMWIAPVVNAASSEAR